MDRFLKHIQRIRPAAFCSRDFFLLHDNAPAHKAASVCQFLTQKNVTTLYHPVLSRFISARLFSVPQVENEVKRTPLCGRCWDPTSHNWWIMEGPEREIFSRFSENVRPQKIAVILHKICMYLPHVSMIIKKFSPKTFRSHCKCVCLENNLWICWHCVNAPWLFSWLTCCGFYLRWKHFK